MKVDEIKKELEVLSIDQLQEKIDHWQRELFSLRLNASTTHIKDYSQFSKVKRNIARAYTFLKKKQANI